MRNRQRNLELQKEYYKSHRDVSFPTVTIRCSFVGNVDVNENQGSYLTNLLPTVSIMSYSSFELLAAVSIIIVSF